MYAALHNVRSRILCAQPYIMYAATPPASDLGTDQLSPITICFIRIINMLLLG